MLSNFSDVQFGFEFEIAQGGNIFLDNIKPFFIG